MLKEKSILVQLADFTHSISFETIPLEVVNKTKLCIMDAIECCLTSMSDQRTEAAFNSIKKSTEFECTLFGTPYKASAEDASFYNTVKGAITSRNDSSRTAICHPGSILIPTTFALGEEICSSGTKIIESLVCGYETMIRLGASFVSAKINGAWRNTSLVAPFGAAFSAAKMMNLDVNGIASSASFSCHFAGGLNEWAIAGTGEDIFQNGWGARNGILSMRLAKAGAFGCNTIIEGKSGLLNAIGSIGTKDMLVDGLGEKFLILEIMHKPINSCFIVQGPSQTALKVVKMMPTNYDPSDIVEIIISMPKQAIDYPGCNNTEVIDSLVQGIMSIALGVSSTIYNRSTENINWTPPIHPAIIELMHKCKLIEDKNKTSSFPRLQGSRVTVKMKNGNQYEYDQEDVIPLSENEVKQKFINTVINRLGREKGRKVIDLVNHFEEISDINELTKLLITNQ